MQNLVHRRSGMIAAATLSCDKVVDYVAGEVGQAIIAAAVMISELRVVDTKLVENRRVNVVHMHWILNCLPPEIVGSAVGESALASATIAVNSPDLSP